jgi:hypothetical protein
MVVFAFGVVGRARLPAGEHFLIQRFGFGEQLKPESHQPDVSPPTHHSLPAPRCR